MKMTDDQMMKMSTAQLAKMGMSAKQISEMRKKKKHMMSTKEMGERMYGEMSAKK